MGKKVCENVDSKRELLYSFSTLVFTPLLYYFAVTSAVTSSVIITSEHHHDPTASAPLASSPRGEEGGSATETENLFTPPQQQSNGEDRPGGSGGNNSDTSDADPLIGFILEHRELPFETVFYVAVFEVLKLLLVFTVFPGSHLFDQTPPLQVMLNLTSGGTGGAVAGASGKSAQGRLPFNKKDSTQQKSPPLQIKVMELWKGFCNFTAGCVICHVFVVLLGAPIIDDCKATFQFSVILTSLLFSPLCLAVQPSRLLQELMFISLWNSENEILNRTKWKFAATVFGAWAGAIVIPLDWDRPWQKWPIPCLYSTIFIFIISNLVLTIHLFCSISGAYHRIYMISTESNKIKNF